MPESFSVLVNNACSMKQNMAKIWGLMVGVMVWAGVFNYGKKYSYPKNDKQQTNRRKKIGDKPLFKIAFTFLLLIVTTTSFTQFIVASDNAGNYGTWTNGSNGGSGFAAWAITTGGPNAGTFIGNPANNGMETTGIGTTAFGMFGHGGQFVNAVRNFNTPMEVGDVLTFHWAMNFDCGTSGSKGFDLRNGATVIFNANNTNSPTITYGGVATGTISTNYGVTPMLITVSRISASQYTITVTRRFAADGTFSVTINSSLAINNINLYCGAQQDNTGNRNIYFNNFQIQAFAPRINGTGGVVNSAPGSGTNGYVGNLVTISGQNLANVSTVRVGGSGGTPVGIMSQSATSLTFNAINIGGVIYVENPSGNATSAESYTNLGFISTSPGGNWTTNTTWLGGTAPVLGTDRVTIASGAPVTLNTTTTIQTLTINSGATFTGSDATPRTLNILSNTPGTTLTNNGNWVNGTGGSTVDFRSDNAITHTISGTIGFQNVSITRNSGTPNIGLNFGTGSTINGNFQINVGGFVAVNAAPIYAVGSTLVYASGTTYGRSDEWIMNNPHNVRITNGTTLDIRNASAAARNMSGNLIIEAGSTASMGNMTGALTVGGNVEINGTLTLSSQPDGNLNVGGNFTNNGTFSGTGRTVTYNGTSSQTITGNTTFATLVNANGSGNSVSIANGTTVTLSTTGTFITANSSFVVNGLLVNNGTITLNNATAGFTVNGTVTNTSTINANTNGIFTVNGTVTNSGTINGTFANLEFSATGLYQHNFTTTAGTIPTAEWQAGSTCAIIGYTTYSSGGGTIGGLSQNFHHFLWNCPAQEGNINFLGNLNQIIGGHFSVITTNTGAIRWTAGASVSTTINGNFILDAGRIDLSTGSGNPIINVAGNFNQTSGTLDFLFTGGSGGSTLNVAGSVTQSAGTIIRTVGSTHVCTFGFNGSNNQLINFAGTVSNVINFRLNNPAGITIAGSLTINNGATFFRTQGAATGNITYTGTTSLVYDGVSLITTDVEWPSTNGPANVTINTAALTDVITLHNSRTIIGILTLTSGRLSIQNNDLTVTNNIPTAISWIGNASSYISQTGTGQLIRQLINTGLPRTFEFPVGDNNGLGSLTISFTANNTNNRQLGVRTLSGTANMFSPNTPPDYLSRYWETSLSNTDGNYTYFFNRLEYQSPSQVVGDQNNINISSFLSGVWTDVATSSQNPLIATGNYTQLTAPLDGGHFSGRNSSALYTWTGTISNSWDVTSNWSPAGFPSPTDRILVDNSASNPLVISDAKTISTATLQGTGVVTVTGTGSFQATTFSLQGTSAINLQSGSSLTLTGTTITYVSTATANFDCNSTVNYSGTGGQTIMPVQYGNLVATGGNRTFTNGAITRICGIYTAVAATTTTGSTISFNGGGVQVVPGAHNYNALVIANTNNISPVTMGGNFSIANGFTINNDSYFEIQAGRTLTLSGGNSQVNGRLRNSNTFSQSGGTLSFGPNSLYEHNITGGSLPNATWDNTAPGATCAVIGWAGSTGAPGNLTPSGGFSNFTWNSPGQSGSPNFEGALQLINRTFAITNTGASNRIFLSNASNGSLQVGAIVVNGGTLATNNNAGVQSISSGSVSVISGTLQLEGNGSGITTVSGLFSHTGGTIIRNSGTQIIEFNGALNQTVESIVPSNISGQVNFRVNNPNGITIPSGSTFPINGGTTLQISQGNVTLNSSASINYGNSPSLAVLEYNPSGSTDITTNDEWPLTGMRRVRINSTSSFPVSLNASREMGSDALDIINFDNGRLALGGHNLTLKNRNSGALTVANGYVETNGSGSLIREMLLNSTANYLFPVGNANYSPVSYNNFTGTTNNTQISVRSVGTTHPDFVATPPADFLQNRYWVTNVTPSTAGYTYTPTYTFQAGDIFGNPANVRLSRWNLSSWTNIAGSSVSGNTLTSGALTQVTGNLANAQWSGRAIKLTNTYTWNISSGGPWTTAANWNPNGIPGSEDEVRFNHNGIYEVNNIPTEINPARMYFTGGGTTTLLVANSGTITLGNGANQALQVDAGTSMVVSGNLASNWIILGGSTGSVAGNVQLRGVSSSTAHTLQSQTNSGLTFLNGSKFEAGVLNTTNFDGSPFGNGVSGSVVFSSGSVFEQFDGGNSFGSNNVTIFQPGSLYRFSDNSIAPPSFSGRNYANFEYNSNVVGGKSVTGGAAFTMDNLTVTQGTFNINMTGTLGHAIRGNITVANGASLNFSPASAGTVNLSGTGLQTLSGGGNIVVNNNATLNISNSSAGGVRLERDVTVTGTGLVNVANGGNLRMPGETTLTGTGTFTVSNNGMLGIGSVNGITASTGNGNIRTSTRNFGSGGNYVYMGTSNQTTGNGLPPAITGRLEVANTGAAGNNIVSLTTIPTTTANLTLTSGLFQTGGANNEIIISAGGTVNGSGGDFVVGDQAGTVHFNTSGGGSFTGSLLPYNVVVKGPVDFGPANVTIQEEGTFRIDAGGGVVGEAPFYGIESILQYNTGGVYDRYLEWSAGGGRGSPYQVKISGGTTLSSARNDGSFANRDFVTAGNLTIESGSSLYMYYNNNNMTIPLRVGGNILIEGDLSGSKALGGDIELYGNWTRTETGLFFPYNRAVFFRGSGNLQTITNTHSDPASRTETFDYLVIDKDDNVVQLNNNPDVETDVKVNGNAGGNNLQLLRGGFDLNGRTFEWGGNGNLLVDGGLRSIFSATPATFRVGSGSREVVTMNNGKLEFDDQTTVIISGGLNFAPNTTTINATLRIDPNGFANVHAPIYGPEGTLIYNNGLVDYLRRVEWSGDIDGQPGYPNDVIIRSGTTLFAAGNNGEKKTIAASARRDIIIESGSGLNLSGAFNMEKNLIAGRDLIIQGSLVASDSNSSHIRVGRNWNRSGSFTHKNRIVIFDSATNGTIKYTGVGNETFPKMIVDKDGSANNTLTLQSPVDITQKLTLTSGRVITDATNLLSISNDAPDDANNGVEASTGFTSNGYVEGPMVRDVKIISGDQSYLFPVGYWDGVMHHYKRMKMRDVTAGSTFLTEYVRAQPQGPEPLFFQSDILGILKDEYWNVTRTGTAWARLVLPYTNPGPGGWLNDSKDPTSPPVDANVAVLKGTAPDPMLPNDYNWNYTGHPDSMFFNNEGSEPQARYYTLNGDVRSRLITDFSPFTLGFGYNAVLPLQLLSFHATLHAADAQLTWKLADSKDLRHFEVEHSTDGRQFVQLGKVEPHGGNDFSFRHKNLASGAHYYRLLMVEKDGRKSHSKIEVLLVNDNRTLITGLLQNPIIGGQAIVRSYSATQQAAHIMLMDMSGKMLLRQKVHLQTGYNQSPVSLMLLPAGMYKLYMQTNDGVEKVITVMKL